MDELKQKHKDYNVSRQESINKEVSKEIEAINAFIDKSKVSCKSALEKYYVVNGRFWWGIGECSGTIPVQKDTIHYIEKAFEDNTNVFVRHTRIYISQEAYCNPVYKYFDSVDVTILPEMFGYSDNRH